MSSLSFNWKRIEETPENSDDVRLLIEDVNEKYKKKGEILKQPLNLLEVFIEKFKMEKFFKMEERKEKQKKVSKKDLIILENEKKTLENEFNQFVFNEDFSLKRVHFLFPVNNYLYILYWCLIILRGLKEKKNIQSIIILDATISLNRILLKDIITDLSYKSGFTFFDQKMNSLMNESFYNLLFQNPKMLYQSSFQKFNKEIQLYKEQKIILEKIKSSIDTDSPLLLGNQMPTGQGKTFLSVPLAKMLSMEKTREKKKCVLFACSNELVNMDVASNALVGNDIH
jgi:CRISPR/Cas system-associated endonuclease/helicase Cas3